jgi:hypothetical protein
MRAALDTMRAALDRMRLRRDRVTPVTLSEAHRSARSRSAA